MRGIVFAILLFPTFLAAQFSDAQQKELDRLNALLQHPASHDTSLAYAHIALSDIWYYSNMDTVIPLAEKTRKIVLEALRKNPIPEVKRRLLISLAAAYNNIGVINDDKGNVHISLEFYEKALKIREELGDKSGQAESLNNIGIIYRNHGDIEKALECYQKSIQIRTEIDDKHGIAQSLNNTALIYKNQDDITQALEYYFQALEIHKELKSKRDLPVVLNNIGTSYRALGEYEKALSYYEQSLDVYEELGNKLGSTISLNNIGDAYLKLGKFQKAVGYIETALALTEELGYKEGTIISTQILASIYFEKKDFDKAKTYGQLVLKLSQELGAPRLIARSAIMLKSIAQSEGHFQEALAMYELHITMRDSIKNEATQKASIRQQTQYEFEKSQLVKEQEEKEVRRKTKEVRQRRDNLQYSVILISLLVIGGLLAVIGRFSMPMRVAEGLIFFAFLLFFEFLLVLADPYIESWSGGAPGIKLLFNAGIAALIFPAHAFFETRLKGNLAKRA